MKSCSAIWLQVVVSFPVNLTLAARFQRFELILLGSALGVWLLAVIVVGANLASYVSEYPTCFGLATTGGEECQAPSLLFGIWDQTAELLLWAVLAIPIVFAAILGAPIVSREVEHGTAQLVWALSPSRHSWLGFRAFPVLLVLAAMLLIAAVGGEYLQMVRLAGDDPGFLRFDQRGALVITRGLVAFAIALLVGALVSRTLPAVLVALVAAAVFVLGSVLALDVWRRAEAEVVDFTQPGVEDRLAGALLIEPVAILPNGELTTDFNQDLPPGTNWDAYRILPRDRYSTWIVREASIDLIGAALAASAAAIVLTHRRPI